MITLPTIESFVQSLASAKRVTPDTSLSAALGPDVTTHDAVLVFDESDFLGIVTPYQTLYKNRYPKDTKTRDALLKPPILTKDTPVTTAVTHMLALRLYILPVFDARNSPVGIISARSIARSLVMNKEFSHEIATRTKYNEPITIRKGSKVKEAHEMLRKKNISRLIVVDSAGKVAGIITRSDMADAFLTPSDKQRFRSGGRGQLGGASIGRASHLMFDGERIKRTDAPIDLYMSEKVFSLPHGTPIHESLLTMMREEYSSIVFLDRESKPRGFLSLRDVLYAIEKLEGNNEARIVLSVSGSMSKPLLVELEERLQTFGNKCIRRVPFSHMNARVDIKRSTKGKAERYAISIHFADVPGRDLRADTEHGNPRTALTEAFAKIESQLR